MTGPLPAGLDGRSSPGPLLARSLRGVGLGMLPLAAFYIAYRIAGTTPAVVAGVVATLAVFPLERKVTGATRWAWIGLAGVALGAVLAVATNDPKLFFLRVVIGDAVWGVAMLGSLVMGRPLVGVFASWVVPIPDVYKATSAYRRSFGLVTLVWGVVTLGRGALRAWLLATGTLEDFIGVQLLTAWPVFAGLLVFAIWYPRLVAKRWLASQGLDPGEVDAVLRP